MGKIVQTYHTSSVIQTALKKETTNINANETTILAFMIEARFMNNYNLFMMNTSYLDSLITTLITHDGSFVTKIQQYQEYKY